MCCCYSRKPRPPESTRTATPRPYTTPFRSRDATAVVTSTCTNQGGTQAPGQNPAPLTVTGSQAIPEDELKNGTTPFAVETVAPDPVIAGAPDCPNPNWTELIEDLAFTSAVITVEQPPGTVVLTVTCTQIGRASCRERVCQYV